MARDQFATETAAAPALLQEKLNSMNAALPEFRPPEGATVKDLETLLQREQQRQQEAGREAADAEKERQRRSERRTLVPERIAEVRKLRAAVPAEPADTGVDPRLLAARRAALAFEQRKLDAELVAA